MSVVPKNWVSPDYAKRQKVYHQHLLQQQLSAAARCQAYPAALSSNPSDSSQLSSPVETGMPFTPTNSLFHDLAPMTQYPMQSTQSSVFDVSSLSDPAWGGSTTSDEYNPPAFDKLYDPSFNFTSVSNNPYVYNPFAPGASYTNDLLGLHNGPFRGPDTAMSDYSYVPHLPVAINPDWLQSNKSPQHDPETPGSILRSISRSSAGAPSPIHYTPPEVDYAARRRSAGDAHESKYAPRKYTHKRKATLDAAFELPHTPLSPTNPVYDREARLRELEQLEVEEGIPVTRRDRRRLQNRLAQRAFRARSKVKNQASVEHMSDLEILAETQGQRLHRMTALVAQLRVENATLKTGQSRRNSPTHPHPQRHQISPEAGPSRIR